MPEQDEMSDLAAADDDRAPYPTRVRVIFVLAIACWAVIAAAVTVAARL